MPKKLSDAKAGEKLLKLYTLLMMRGDRAISLAQLAETLECSKQTVLRLLAQVGASSYGKLAEPIIVGREHYYRLAELPSAHFDLGVMEIAQLALCRQILLNFLPNKELKITPRSSSHECIVGERPDNNYDIVYKGFIDYLPYQKRYDLLLQAIRQQRVCKVS